MSQYKDIGLVDRFTKIKDDALVPQDDGEAELGIVRNGEVVQEGEQDESESGEEEEKEEGEMESEGEENGDEEDDSDDAEKKQKKAKKGTAALREIVERMTPKDFVAPIPKLKEWEEPIVKRLMQKYKDNYRVPPTHYRGV